MTKDQEQALTSEHTERDIPANSPTGPELRQSEKAVDISKKALDTASYKLYYVNYKIWNNPPSQRRKDAAGTPQHSSGAPWALRLP
jgi:hypothetical protein